MLKDRELILRGGGEADISHSLVNGLWNLRSGTDTSALS